MDKKVLKFYEAPEVEIVEMELEGFLCESTDVPELEDGGELE